MIISLGVIKIDVKKMFQLEKELFFEKKAIKMWTNTLSVWYFIQNATSIVFFFKKQTLKKIKRL